MKHVRWVSVLALFSICVPLFAQEKNEAALERQRKILAVVDSLVADARELTLPENKAVCLATVGQRLWEIDRKRAQDLFAEAVGELLAAQAEAELDRMKGKQNELTLGQSTRPAVLRTIGARNADFALKSFYRTRPGAVERAIQNVSPKDSKIRSTGGNDSNLIQNELSLEQYLVNLAAEQNPEKAAELLRTALKKGVTGEALQLLRKLHSSDPAAAAEMGSEVVGQLARKGFMNAGQMDWTAVQTSLSFLQEHIRQRSAAEKSFRFAAAEMRSLADKLISFFLERGNQFGYGYTQQLVPIAEKLRPDAVERLKEVSQNSPRHGLVRVENPDFDRLMRPETPLEQVIAEAPKLPAELRRSVYHQAANRLSASGDPARARQLINDNFSDEALVNARESLDWYHVHQLINQGKYAEAEVMIEQFPDGNRFSALISLADSVFNRDPVENKTQALAILGKAGAGLPARPENNNELSQMNRLIAAYTRIEPPEAFRLFESLLPQLNELTEAMMIVNSFNGGYNIRRGEAVISSGGAVSVQLDGSLFRGLAEKDFDRTLALIAGLSRRELRVRIKQDLLGSF